MNHRNVELTEEQLTYLDGLLEAFEDLPDGPWRTACTDAISMCEEFVGMNPLDVFSAWLYERSVEAEGSDEP